MAAIGGSMKHLKTFWSSKENHMISLNNDVNIYQEDYDNDEEDDELDDQLLRDIGVDLYFPDSG
jgi:hypothetical protein